MNPFCCYNNFATIQLDYPQVSSTAVAIRTELGVYLDQGMRIQHDIEYSNHAAVREATAWKRQVEGYLAKELDNSYVARFRNPVRVPVSYPKAMSMEMAVPWTDVMERVAVLNAFTSELRD